MKDIRPAAVAGQFYEADAAKLKQQIDGYLQNAMVDQTGKNLRALIAPHAGYVYSGPVAAYSYKAIDGHKFKRVILIGNSHTAYFKGLTIDDHTAWKTPLGEVAVDLEGAQKIIAADPLIHFDRTPHLKEHALEVQLPFLQMMIKNDFKIIPILFGLTEDRYYEILARGLKNILQPDDLIVASSDMSHYLPYDEARIIDDNTLRQILDKTNPAGDNILCGPDGIKTLIHLTKELEWEIELLQYANSGDTTGDKDAVVGYGSLIFVEPAPKKSAPEKK